MTALDEWNILSAEGKMARVEERIAGDFFSESERAIVRDVLRLAKDARAEHDQLRHERDEARHQGSELSTAKQEVIDDLLRERDAALALLRRMYDEFRRDHGGQPQVKALLGETRALLAAHLAYIGDHHFPDQTWKARCEEVVGDLRRVEQERDAARAEAIGWQAAAQGDATAWQRLWAKQAAEHDAALALLREARQVVSDRFGWAINYCEDCEGINTAFKPSRNCKVCPPLHDLLTRMDALLAGQEPQP